MNRKIQQEANIISILRNTLQNVINRISDSKNRDLSDISQINLTRMVLDELSEVERIIYPDNIDNTLHSFDDVPTSQGGGHFEYSSSDLEKISHCLLDVSVIIDDIMENIEFEIFKLESIILSDIDFDKAFCQSIKDDLEATRALVRAGVLSVSRHGRYLHDDECSDKFDLIASDTALQCTNAALVLANVVMENIDRYEKAHRSIAKRVEYKKEMNSFFDGIANVWQSYGRSVNYSFEYREFFEAVAGPVCRYYARRRNFGMSWQDNWRDLFNRHVERYNRTHQI